MGAHTKGTPPRLPLTSHVLVGTLFTSLDPQFLLLSNKGYSDTDLIEVVKCLWHYWYVEITPTVINYRGDDSDDGGDSDDDGDDGGNGGGDDGDDGDDSGNDDSDDGGSNDFGDREEWCVQII